MKKSDKTNQIMALWRNGDISTVVAAMMIDDAMDTGFIEVQKEPPPLPPIPPLRKVVKGIFQNV